jgi:glyoxylase-like metal-dependent hydrolase (beta-lactamase superfamily II)
VSKESIGVGDIELTSLLDVVGELDGSLEESFPGVPHSEWPDVKAAIPALVGPSGGWRLHVRCTLIRAAGRVILVDTGVGTQDAPAFDWFLRPGALLRELAADGLDPADVDTVVLTHVHDDHVGGTVVGTTPAFPNARYLLHRSDREAQRAWAAENDEDRAIDQALLVPLERAGVLDLLDGETSVADGVRIRPAPGHTPGHQVVEITSGGERGLISGDTFNLPVQLSESGWHSSSDHDPSVAGQTRRRLCAELQGGETIVVPSHFAEPFGRVVLDADGSPVWSPIDP